MSLSTSCEMTARFSSTVSAWLRLGPAPICHDSLLILLAMRACRAAVPLLMVALVLTCTSTRRRPRATEGREGKQRAKRTRAQNTTAGSLEMSTVQCTVLYSTTHQCNTINATLYQVVPTDGGSRSNTIATLKSVTEISTVEIS